MPFWDNIFPAIIGVAGNLIGAGIQSSAAGNAANVQAQAAIQAMQMANDQQWKMFQAQTGLLQPWIGAGGNAAVLLSQLASPVGYGYYPPTSTGTGGGTGSTSTAGKFAQWPWVPDPTAQVTPYNRPASEWYGTGAPPVWYGYNSTGSPNLSDFENYVNSQKDPMFGDTLVWNQSEGGLTSISPTYRTPPATTGTVSTGTAPAAGINPALSGPNPYAGSLWRNFGLQDFYTDPGYMFRLQQGQLGLDRSAASQGRLFSGGTLKDLTQYNQDFASGEFQNAYNRFQSNRATRYNQLASLAGLGQMSANTLSNAGSNAANQMGNNTFNAITQAGNARASGYAASGNAWGNAIGNLGGTIGQAIQLSQMGKGGIGSPLQFPTSGSLYDSVVRPSYSG